MCEPAGVKLMVLKGQLKYFKVAFFFSKELFLTDKMLFIAFTQNHALKYLNYCFK